VHLQVYDLLNALEDRLAVNSSAVVLGATKVFLFQTLNMTITHQQVRTWQHHWSARQRVSVAYCVTAFTLCLDARCFPACFSGIVAGGVSWACDARGCGGAVRQGSRLLWH
jgi:hypothetical protein